MKNEYYGVLNKEGSDYIILNNGEDINLSNTLKEHWQNETPVHIKIQSEERSLLNERSDEIYMDKGENFNFTKKYTYHINGLDIEHILSEVLYNQIYICITSVGKDNRYGIQQS